MPPKLSIVSPISTATEVQLWDAIQRIAQLAEKTNRTLRIVVWQQWATLALVAAVLGVTVLK